jgi:hypothetical protein
MRGFGKSQEQCSPSLRFCIASKERTAPGFFSLTAATPTVGTSTRVDPGIITVSTGSVVVRCVSRLRRAVISQRLLDWCVQSALPSFSLNVSDKLALEGLNDGFRLAVVLLDNG